uniref:Uncharacterized protein n=1 Tax=Romanomermis culicivorax TaxID=13658 RepID=A0A915HPI1_ROMCU
MLGTLLLAKLRWEVDMQIEKVDDQRCRHSHGNRVPQKDKNSLLWKSEGPKAQALTLIDVKRQEDL